jgi:hypothetical protein
MTSPEKPPKNRWSVLILIIIGAMAIIATISEQHLRLARRSALWQPRIVEGA